MRFCDSGPSLPKTEFVSTTMAARDGEKPGNDTSARISRFWMSQRIGHKWQWRRSLMLVKVHERSMLAQQVHVLTKWYTSCKAQHCGELLGDSLRPGL